VAPWSCALSAAMPAKGEVAAAEAVVNDVQELDLERVGIGESLVRWLSCTPLPLPLSAVSRRAPRRRCAASATGILQRWRGSKRLLVEEEKGTRVNFVSARTIKG
jgi:hypothetical protein